MQSAHGSRTFQPTSQGDHTVLIILKETSAGDKHTHSLPPCKQPETMNPKLVASGPHREIYPLCPSSSAPLTSMSTAEQMFNDLHIKSWVCAQLWLPSSFTFQTPQAPYSPSFSRVQLYPALDSLFRFSKELKRKPKASTQIGWWLSSKSPKEGSYKGTAQGQSYPVGTVSVLASAEQKSFSPLVL